MKLLSIASLLYFFAVIISVNATDDTRDAMEIDEIPRVKIKVFRGSNKKQNGEQFATWGFWIKQPTTMKLTH